MTKEPTKTYLLTITQIPIAVALLVIAGPDAAANLVASWQEVPD